MSDVSVCKQGGNTAVLPSNAAAYQGGANVLASSSGTHVASNGKVAARTRKATRNLTTRVSEELYTAVLAYAANHDVTPSNLVRELLMFELQDQSAMNERRAMAELPIVVAGIREELSAFRREFREAQAGLKES